MYTITELWIIPGFVWILWFVHACDVLKYQDTANIQPAFETACLKNVPESES